MARSLYFPPVLIGVMAVINCYVWNLIRMGPYTVNKLQFYGLDTG